MVVVTGHDEALVSIEGVPGMLAGSASVQAPAGPHIVNASHVSAAQSGITRQVFEPTIDHPTICVRAGETTVVNVTYALVPTSGKLWAGVGSTSDATTMLGFAPASVAAAGTASADVAANTGGSDGFTFDRAGNMWVLGATPADPKLARYPASAFASGGDKTPDVIIDSSSFGDASPGPKAVAFDAAGSLWVSVVAAGKVVMFTAGQIAASAQPLATVERTGIRGPRGLAFDATGNLWIAAEDDTAVVRVDSNHLTASGPGGDHSITAKGMNDVTLRPVGLAFDAAGNLWVNYDGTIASITPAQQAGTGTHTITPAIQITTDVLTLPVGIAFDQDGGLWFAHEAGKFARLDAAQLTASGSVAPAIVITSPDVGSATWFAMYPAPPGTPLYHKMP
jgi:sugar lactone lactonase YvrE